ncbi:SpoIIE family protein phosphatase [Leptolyngbya ohadii]|uniref:SpoIIE family protein phosphatase n=1 Tax=Leptolyngbya ohadii TaxID=1962290 RepID=UPI000B59F780|nr:SpoIIE family protein phosphatase [Leptolyngbya ohadii]
MAHSVSGKLPLMIVDDESDNLDLLERTFRRSFTVHRANSGLEALQLLEQVGEMAVIISDQRMPEMSGTDFLSRTVDRFPDTVRILLTGYSDVQDLVGAINRGKVFKYITKPWSPEELSQAVQQAGEIYQVVKQRTAELHRALRQESAINATMSAIRESLDYCSMLKAIVRTFHATFAVEVCSLYPIALQEELLSAAAAKMAPEVLDNLPGHLSIHLSGDPARIPCSFPQIFPEFVAGELSEAFFSAFIAPLPQGFSEEVGKLHCEAILDRDQKIHRLMVPLCDPRNVQEQLAIVLLLRQNPWSEEDLQLIQTVAAQVALALSQAKLYQQLQVQTEQMRSQLAIARNVQASLMRQTLPQLEQTLIQAVSIPAQEIGGDFFEVYEHPEGHVWLAVGDVSGKGVPAALLMASVISLLRRELTQDRQPNPNEVLQNLNHSLFQELVASSCLITLVLARYLPATGEFLYANAGHVYPIVWSRLHQDGLEPTYLQVRGIPLGILPLWQADFDKLTLTSGDVVLMVSDGITEAQLGAKASSSPQESTVPPLLRSTGLWEILRQRLHCATTLAQQASQPASAGNVKRSSFDLNEVLSEVRNRCPVQDDDQTLLTLEVL